MWQLAAGCAQPADTAGELRCAAHRWAISPQTPVHPPAHRARGWSGPRAPRRSVGGVCSGGRQVTDGLRRQHEKVAPRPPFGSRKICGRGCAQEVGRLQNRSDAGSARHACQPAPLHCSHAHSCARPPGATPCRRSAQSCPRLRGSSVGPWRPPSCCGERGRAGVRLWVRKQHSTRAWVAAQLRRGSGAILWPVNRSGIKAVSMGAHSKQSSCPDTSAKLHGAARGRLRLQHQKCSAHPPYTGVSCRLSCSKNSSRGLAAQVSRGHLALQRPSTQQRAVVRGREAQAAGAVAGACMAGRLAIPDARQWELARNLCQSIQERQYQCNSS